MKKISARLRRWNQIFCAGMTCKANMKRDAVIVSIAIILSTAFIGADHYLYNKKIQTVKTADFKIAETLPQQEFPEQVNPLQQETSEQEKLVQQEIADQQIPVQDNRSSIRTETVQPKPKASIAIPPRKISETKSTGLSCIKMPANILPLLKGAPTPPDGKMKNGKLVCHVLADGHKDHPEKSSRNPKGQWGGCCYDPDEVPNPNCCYPVGSVYENPLNKYFKNPFPHRK